MSPFDRDVRSRTAAAAPKTFVGVDVVADLVGESASVGRFDAGQNSVAKRRRLKPTGPSIVRPVSRARDHSRWFSVAWKSDTGVASP